MSAITKLVAVLVIASVVAGATFHHDAEIERARIVETFNPRILTDQDGVRI